MEAKVSGLGPFIKQQRTEKGITQERLCAGLCDISTLSRIERGLITPASFLRHALLERLGYYANSERGGFWDESNIEFVERKKALTMATLHKNVPEMKRLISKYKKNKEFSEGIGLQSMKTSKVMLDMYENRAFDFNRYMKTLLNAIKITIPNFDKKEIRNYLLTIDEMRCINVMSSVYLRNGNNEESLYILLALKDNLDKFCVNKYEISWYYPSILINIAWHHYQFGDIKEAIALCETCREFCIKCNEYGRIAALLLLYGSCLVKVGNLAEAKILLRHSYHIHRAFLKNDEADQVETYYSNVFDDSVDPA